jgi:hypothetical protein
MMTQAEMDREMNREISGCIAFALCPDKHVKRLAEQLTELDLLTTLIFTGRLSELLGSYSLDDLTKLLVKTKQIQKRNKKYERQHENNGL